LAEALELGDRGGAEQQGRGWSNKAVMYGDKALDTTYKPFRLDKVVDTVHQLSTWVRVEMLLPWFGVLLCVTKPRLGPALSCPALEEKKEQKENNHLEKE
jgi:hypothetical protein